MLGSTSSTASALLIRRRTSCLACKRSRRQLGSSPPPAAGPVRTFNREDVAFPFCAPVPGRSVLRITGRDASRFLNGLAAVRIPETLETGLSPLYAAFLHAQGRILHDTFIYSDPSTRSFLIDHPASATSPSPSSSTPLAPGGNGDGPPTLEAHLKRFILRSKVGVKDVSSQWAVWAAWGHDEVDERTWGGVRRWRWGNGESAELGWKEEPARWVPRRASEGENPSDEVMGGWDARAPGMGWRGLIRRAEMATTTAPSLLSPSTSDPVPSAAYTAHRLSLGVPEGPKELVPLSALPSESNLDFMGGVDFRKGCYVGQELTVRTYHTGQTRKRIIPIELLGIGEEEKEQPEEALEGASVQLVFKPQTISPNSADESASPSNPALNTLVAPTAAASRRPTRPKSTGRLLSYDRSTNQGLALLRLDQVNLCLSGEATLMVILPSAAAGEGQSGATGNPGHGQTQKGTERTVGLRPRLDKVDWWPVRPPPSPTVATGAATTSAASTPMPID